MVDGMEPRFRVKDIEQQDYVGGSDISCAAWGGSLWCTTGFRKRWRAACAAGAGALERNRRWGCSFYAPLGGGVGLHDVPFSVCHRRWCAG